MGRVLFLAYVRRAQWAEGRSAERQAAASKGEISRGRRGGDFLRGRGELGCVGDCLDTLSFCCCDWPLRIVKCCYQSGFLSWFDPAADQKFSYALMQSSEVFRKGNYLDLKKKQNFNSSIL